jgi:hypothetical protein
LTGLPKSASAAGAKVAERRDDNSPAFQCRDKSVKIQVPQGRLKFVFTNTRLRVAERREKLPSHIVAGLVNKNECPERGCSEVHFSRYEKRRGFLQIAKMSSGGFQSNSSDN